MPPLWKCWRNKYGNVKTSVHLGEVTILRWFHIQLTDRREQGQQRHYQSTPTGLLLKCDGQLSSSTGTVCRTHQFCASTDLDTSSIQGAKRDQSSIACWVRYSHHPDHQRVPEERESHSIASYTIPASLPAPTFQNILRNCLSTCPTSFPSHPLCALTAHLYNWLDTKDTQDLCKTISPRGKGKQLPGWNRASERKAEAPGRRKRLETHPHLYFTIKTNYFLPPFESPTEQEHKKCPKL